MVQGGGFEPPKLARQIYSLIPLATREPLRDCGAFYRQPTICQLVFYELANSILITLEQKDGAGDRS